MDDTSLPPADLILQALHGIRADLRGTNARLDQLRVETSTRLGRLEDGLALVGDNVKRLERRTTEGLIKTNTKLATLTKVVDQQGRRLDHMLTHGMGAEVRSLRVRVDRLESARSARKKR